MTWEIRLGDCLDPATGLASLADKSVDHVITDPPFTQRTSDGARSLGARAQGDAPKPFIDFAGVDGLEPAITAACLRVARRWTMIWCAFEQVGIYQQAAGDLYVRAGVWHKPDATPQFTGDRPAMCGEACVILHAPGKKSWNGGGRPAFWSVPTCKGDERPAHPTPKPVALMEKIIRDFTDPGETILDPFAGSGTTGVAAVRLGRKFIGWERDPKYHAVATKRLQATGEQLDLLAPRRSRKRAQQASLLDANKVVG